MSKVLNLKLGTMVIDLDGRMMNINGADSKTVKVGTYDAKIFDDLRAMTLPQSDIIENTKAQKSQENLKETKDLDERANEPII
ncbi:MAG: hypothetical protein RSB76_01740 [Clostridia bacterium]